MALGWVDEMNFPFTEFMGFAEDRVFRPMIPIAFEANNKSFDGYALIDSGSDYNVLPVQVAYSLGLDLSGEVQYRVSAADGRTFTVYKSPLAIDHLIKKRDHKTIKWKSFVYFSDSVDNILLGESGFVDRFRVVLDGKNRKIEIEP